MKLYMQLMTTTALALSVAACGSSNGVDKVIDVTDITEEAQAKRTFATDEDGDPVDAGAAIASGKTLTARAVGVYTAQHNDKLEMTDGILDGRSSISGIVVGKDDAALQNALTLALVSAINDGTYAKILDNFGVPEGILTVEQVETPPSF